jgi:hypothetical protein
MAGKMSKKQEIETGIGAGSTTRKAASTTRKAEAERETHTQTGVEIDMMTGVQTPVIETETTETETTVEDMGMSLEEADRAGLARQRRWMSSVEQKLSTKGTAKECTQSEKRTSVEVVTEAEAEMLVKAQVVVR